MVLQEPSTYNPNLFLMDAIHLSCTIVDVLNLSEERLTPSNKEQNRGSWWDNSSKLVALGLLSWIFFQAQWESGKLGFLRTCALDTGEFFFFRNEIIEFVK